MVGAVNSTLSAYIEAVRELACEILELIAEGLGVPDTWIFSRFIRDVDSDSVLRLNHYPPIINKDNNKDTSQQFTKVGFGEHSDPQIITILRSNEVGGLQISLQMNVGDVLETVMLDFLSDSNGASSLSVPNKDIYAELLKKAKKLNKLKEKDLGFSKFLESYNMKIEQTEYEEIRDWKSLWEYDSGLQQIWSIGGIGWATE
ncbi:hypothetical protein JHK84_034012 [Glycine max]|nr:hypothetical protein JHK85_034390 [Glycine max]KAG5140244.1 hypothetical protein JHK84_034012 [Glycine max]